MKKRLFIILLLIVAVSAQAQTYLVDVYKPTEENRIRVSSSKSDDLKTISYIYRTNGGFSIAGDAHGLIGGDNHGWCTYKIGGKYSKMSFWVGSSFVIAGVGPLNKSVLTIWADGVRIYDQPIFHADAPRFVTLDIEGVDELQFKVIIGEIDLTLGQIQLWQEGVQVVKPGLKTATAVPEGKVKLVEQLVPYFTTRYVHPITDKENVPGLDYAVESISMARHEFKNGLQFTSSEQLAGERVDYSYFWLRKKYEKLSFIVGPRDNQSSNTSAWLVIYGDKKKILYEGIVRQSDVPQQVVVDVKGQDQICFSCELRSNDFLGSITFGAVEIYAHPKGDTTVPKEGPANINKDRVSQLKSPCSLMMNILPYSVRGVAKAKSTLFTGESSYVTFSMGGEKYSEGFILTPGTTLFDDKIDAYATFDLAEEFDYISFYAGALTNRRVLDDGRLLVYADDVKILDTIIHCTWPNAYFELPIHKCRMLKFAKPSDGKNKQIFIGLGDLALYRGKPVKNRLFYHEYPEFDDEADLIDLCGRPYFHYVGRYLSSLTNFDFNDCFKNGSSRREYFQMKDGSQIYKGVMLEANVPLPFEDITLSEAAFMFIVGAGSAMSSSSVGAYTGVTAGAGIGGQMAASRLMMHKGNGQASVVAFNPYGQYQSCTFTIANKSEYWDDMDKLLNLGERKDRPFKLNVFADQRLVAEIWVHNKMQPTTYTIPIFNCRQLLFWLEPDEYRSGQYVLYDMTVSKSPCNTPIPDRYHASPDDTDPAPAAEAPAATTPATTQATPAAPKPEQPQSISREEHPFLYGVEMGLDVLNKAAEGLLKMLPTDSTTAPAPAPTTTDTVMEATPVTFTDPRPATEPVNLPPPVWVE